MRRIKISDINSWYSHNSGLPKPGSEFEPWMIDINETEFAASPATPDVVGLPLELVKEAVSLTQHWMGWGFFTFRTKDTFYSNVPVLLFEDQNDAIIARLRWPKNKWLNTNYADIIWSSLSTL